MQPNFCLFCVVVSIVFVLKHTLRLNMDSNIFVWADQIFPYECVYPSRWIQRNYYLNTLKTLKIFSQHLRATIVFFMKLSIFVTFVLLTFFNFENTFRNTHEIPYFYINEIRNHFYGITSFKKPKICSIYTFFHKSAVEGLFILHCSCQCFVITFTSVRYSLFKNYYSLLVLISSGENRCIQYARCVRKITWIFVFLNRYTSPR